jgi:hypothetical protein
MFGTEHFSREAGIILGVEQMERDVAGLDGLD